MGTDAPSAIGVNLDTNKSHITTLSSRLGFIFIATGAAIGLGNIWKFPYMVGVFGGSAFVLSYLVCVLIIGIPTMMAEILLGRAGRTEPYSCFRSLAEKSNKSKNWGLAGLICILTPILGFSFYSVVAGWAIAYAVMSTKGVFLNASSTQINQLWDNFLQSPVLLVLYQAIFIAATIAVNGLGINKGIERLSKIALPLLFVVLILLVIYAAIYGEFKQTLDFMFGFRPSEINKEAIFSAMGHAFFTLAIGGAAMLIYGSYMPKENCIARSTLLISIVDVIVALVAGLAIFPIVFAYQLTPEAGPGLMFQVLPIAFGQMPYGHAIGFGFFMLLLFSALTTAVAMVEPILAFLMKHTNISRKAGVLVIGAFCFTLGLLAAFSFNILSEIKLFGRWGIFQSFADFTSNILMPVGGLSAAVFVGWVMDQKLVYSQLATVPLSTFKIWQFVLKYITPFGIIAIMFAALM